MLSLSLKISHRWDNGKGYANNEHFTRAINKYGWENFTHEILLNDLTAEEAYQAEIELIAKYDSANRDKGYNKSTGGENSASGHKWTSDFRQKMISINTGKTVSVTTRNKISASMLGRPKAEATKQKMSVAAKAKFAQMNAEERLKPNLKKLKPVTCVETKQSFISMSEAARRCGFTVSNLSIALKNGYKCGGYHWKFDE